MRRRGAPLVWLLVGGLLGAGCRERKKLIEFGWDIPDTAFLRAHAREIDDSPFDGVVFQVQARPGGAASSLSWRAFGRQAFSEADVAQARRDLRATRLRRVRSNFLRLNTTPFDLDWYDDFSSVLGNAELAARLARAGRARGILLDTEAYEAPLFHYARQRRAAERSFEEYAAQVRRRGRELMQAFERGQPGVTLLLTFAHSLPWAWMQRQGVELRETEYGLLAPFVDGLLEGATRGTLVDGHELSYWYREPGRFAAAYQLMSAGVRPVVADPARYHARMGFGFGIWMDYDWRQNGWDAEDPAQNYFTPEGFETAVTAALEASDEFVWIYSETPRWWSKEGGRVRLPDAYDRALRRAKAAVVEPARRLPRRPPPAAAASARGGR